MHVTQRKFVPQQETSLLYCCQNTWLYLKILYWGSYAVSVRADRCKSLTAMMSKQIWHWFTLYYNFESLSDEG